MPAKRTRRRLLLDQVVQAFEPGRHVPGSRGRRRSTAGHGGRPSASALRRPYPPNSRKSAPDPLVSRPHGFLRSLDTRGRPRAVRQVPRDGRLTCRPEPPRATAPPATAPQPVMTRPPAAARFTAAARFPAVARRRRARFLLCALLVLPLLAAAGVYLTRGPAPAPASATGKVTVPQAPSACDPWPRDPPGPAPGTPSTPPSPACRPRSRRAVGRQDQAPPRPVVAGRIRVRVHVRQPASPPPAPSATSPAGTSSGSAAAQVLALINQARSAAGLARANDHRGPGFQRVGAQLEDGRRLRAIAPVPRRARSRRPRDRRRSPLDRGRGEHRRGRPRRRQHRGHLPRWRSASPRPCSTRSRPTTVTAGTSSAVPSPTSASPSTGTPPAPSGSPRTSRTSPGSCPPGCAAGGAANPGAPRRGAHAPTHPAPQPAER